MIVTTAAVVRKEQLHPELAVIMESERRRWCPREDKTSDFITQQLSSAVDVLLLFLVSEWEESGSLES